MVVNINAETVKFIVTQSKDDLDNINFQKLQAGNQFSFNDESWYYWIFDTWLEMNEAYPNYYSDFPPENGWNVYFDEMFM